MLAAFGAAVPTATAVPRAQRAGCEKEPASRLSRSEQEKAFPAALPGNTIGTVRGRSLRPGGGSARAQNKRGPWVGYSSAGPA